MIKRTIQFSIVLLFFVHSIYGQNPPPETRNQVFILLNHHLEKRGTDKYSHSNPDFTLGYERDIFGFGDHRFYAGVRTGVYREYVLTGDGWSHPEKYRFFLGLSPSYLLVFSKNFNFQLNFLWDVLLPDDYDEIWTYWAIEPSFQYFIRDFYLGISATSGVFLFFDPKAYMVKAGIKVGYRF